MATVGVVVSSAEVPQAGIATNNTAAGFAVGFADSGPIGASVQVTSLAGFAAAYGTPQGAGNPYNGRTGTNSTLFDAADVFFREGGNVLYISRVAHGTPTSASIALQNSSSSAALTLTAQYPGAGGQGIFVSVNNTGTAYTVTLSDSQGFILAASPSLTTATAGVTWAATTGLVTGVAGTGIPASSTATALSGGSDNRVSATISDWTNALNSFSALLGPGQVFAPGQTNTNLPGIWSALGNHAFSYNRVALCDMDDNVSASTLVADLASFGTSNVGSYCGFWAGNLNVPGVVSGTTRSVSPSCAIAGLCAQVDATGNPNQPAAGGNYTFNYVSGPTSIVSGTGATYSSNDLYTLNSAGINTFATVSGVFQNYGFVASIPQATDGIYWQFNHARLRMALVSEAQVIGQPFVFSQIDGQGSNAILFAQTLSAMLQNYYAANALYGDTADDAFLVDTSPKVNTPQTIAAGQLNAVIEVRMSPFAQMVSITINAVATTVSLA